MTEAEIKRLVRERDGYKCTQCGMKQKEHIYWFDKQLDVHRLVPGSPYTVDGCVTLCRPCHGPKVRSRPGNRPIRPVTIKKELITKMKIIVQALNLKGGVSGYVTRLVQDAIEKDWPEALRQLELWNEAAKQRSSA